MKVSKHKDTSILQEKPFFKSLSRLLAKSNNIISFIIHLENLAFTFINLPTKHFLLEELPKDFQEFSKLIPKNYQEEWKVNWQKAEVQKEGEFEFPIYIEGTQKNAWFRINFSPIEDQGNETLLLGLLQDITEEKITQEQSNRLKLIPNRVSEAFVILDKQGKFEWGNEVFYRWLDLELTELLGKTLPQILQKQRIKVQQYQKLIQALGQKEDFKLKFTIFPSDEKNRHLIGHFQTNKDYRGNVLWYLARFQDVTEELLTQAKLDQSLKQEKKLNQAIQEQKAQLIVNEQRLKLAMQASKIGCFDWDIQKNKLVWDEAMYNIYKTSPEEVGDPSVFFYSIVHPDQKEATGEFFSRILSPENPDKTFEFEHIVVLPNQELKYIQAQGVILRNEQGEALKLIGTNRDISDFRAIEQELQEKQSILDEAQSIGKVANWRRILSPEKVYWSDNYFRLFQRDPKLGAPSFEEFLSYIHPEDLPLFKKDIEGILNQQDIQVIEFRFLPENSEKYHYAREKIYPVFDELGKLKEVRGVIQDISQEQESNKLLNSKTILQKLSEGIIITDLKGEIQYHNPEVEKLFSLNPIPKNGQHIQKFFPDYAVENVLQSAKKSYFYQDIWQIQGAQQNEKWLLVNVQSLNSSFDPEPRIVWLIKDISVQYRSENLLNELSRLAQVGAWGINLDTQELNWTQDTFRVFQVRKAPRQLKDMLDFFQPKDQRILEESIQRLSKTGEGFDLKMEMLTAKGKERWLRINAKKKSHFSKANMAYGMIQDISELKEAEQSAQNYMDLIEGSEDLFAIVDFEGYFLQINPAWEKTLGYTETELKAKPFIEFVHPEDRNFTAKEREERVVTKTGSQNFQNRYLCKDGSYRWLAWNSLVLHDSEQHYCVVRDITEEKIRAERLKASEAKFKLLSENSHDLICQYDADGIYTYVSPSVENLLGFKASELIGKHPKEVFHPEDIAPMTRGIKEAIAEKCLKSTVEYQTRKKNGEYVWFETISNIMLDEEGNLVSLQTTSRDITQRRLAELKRIESEARLKSIFNATLENFFLIDPAFNILNFNRSAQEHVQANFNHSLEVGDNFLTFTDPKTHSDMQEKVQRALKGERVSDTLQVSLPKGEFWFESTYLPAYNAQGKIDAIAIASLDITARKEVELKLAQNEAYLRAMFNAPKQLFYLISPEYKLLKFNQAASEIFEEVHSHVLQEKDDFLHYVDPEAKADFLENSKKALQGESVSVIRKLIPKPGWELWVQAEYFPAYDANKEIFAFAFVMLDITEEKKNAMKLKENEEFIRAVTNASPNLVQVLDVKAQQFIYKNNSGADVLAGNFDDFLLVNNPAFLKLVHPDDQVKVESQLRALQYLKPGEVKELIFRYKSHSGEWLSLLVRHVLLKSDSENRAWQILGVITDISQEVQNDLKLQEVSNRLYLATRVAQLGVWEYDMQGEMMIWDQQMGLIYGKDPQQIENVLEFWVQSLHPDDRARVQKRKFESIEKGEDYQEDYRIIRADGKVRHIRSFGRMLKDENQEKTRFIGTNRDISEQVQNQEIREQLVQDLKDFAFMTSHNLRRPLANILGLCKVLDYENPAAEFNATVIKSLGIASEEMDAVIQEMNKVLENSNLLTEEKDSHEEE